MILPKLFAKPLGNNTKKQSSCAIRRKNPTDAQ